jgi:hypothetical protein
MKLELGTYKVRLLEILLGENHHGGLLDLIDQLHKQGHAKAEIYDLFLAFHEEIQIDPRTKNDEAIYDRLSDFMDRFTAWGKNFKILPHEPDL